MKENTRTKSANTSTRTRRKAGPRQGSSDMNAMLTRREAIEGIIRRQGLASVHIPALSKHYGVAPSTIRADLAAVLKAAPEREKEQLLARTILGLDSVEALAYETLRGREGKDGTREAITENARLRCLQVLLDVTKARLDLGLKVGFVEQHGLGMDDAPLAVKVVRYDPSPILDAASDDNEGE